MSHTILRLINNTHIQIHMHTFTSAYTFSKLYLKDKRACTFKMKYCIWWHLKLHSLKTSNISLFSLSVYLQIYSTNQSINISIYLSIHLVTCLLARTDASRFLVLLFHQPWKFFGCWRSKRDKTFYTSLLPYSFFVFLNLT